MEKKLFFIAILIFASCSPYQKYFKFDFEPQKAERIKSIVVTPIDMIQARPQGTDAATIKRFEMKIKEYLVSHEYIVESNDTLARNWKIESDKMDGFFDPSTGRLDAAKINICLIKAIAKTKEEQVFNGVLYIQLVERPAKLMGDRVYWDGCSRKLLDANGDVITATEWRGEMKGLSLQAQLFDGNHYMVFQNIGAIEFPFELDEDQNGKQFVWKKTLQFKDDEIKEGISIALHPLIPYDNYPRKPSFYEE
jgi:hypothetical protein